MNSAPHVMPNLFRHPTGQVCAMQSNRKVAIKLNLKIIYLYKR
jgi:hypothetical protein